MAIERGTVIDGKYEILKQLGKGGMSVVYLAMDLRLNKQWAVKVIQRKGIGKNNEIVLNKVPDDTELMKRLDHPAIPRIVDIIDNADDPQIYIVMDYVEGESLDKILAEYGAQSQDLVIDWAKQICDTLGYLHSQKPPIIYRDMKPANVMLKPDGNLKIIDFGISREYKEQNLADTMVMGTRGYVSPESGTRQTDARSDIYSLGMTLHHLVTGVDPRKKQYVPIKQYNPSLMDGLEIIIDKCVQINPDDRYQNCNELMYDLEHIELLGIEYKKQQKRKLFTFIISLSLAIIMAFAGLAGMVVKHRNDANTYDKYVSDNGYIDSAVDENSIAEACFKAMEIDGTNIKAYEKYIEKSTDAGKLLTCKINETDENNNVKSVTYDINKYAKYFSENLDELKEDPNFDKLSFETGYAIFNLSGESELSAALSAQTYFKYVVDIGSFSNYYNIANSFNEVCKFYNDYANSGKTGNESTKKDYETLIKNIAYCVDGDNLSKGFDLDKKESFVKLTLYERFANLINSNVQYFASTGVASDNILDVYNTIFENAKSVTASAEVNKNLQNNIINDLNPNNGKYIRALERAYDNAANSEGRGQ